MLWRQPLFISRNSVPNYCEHKSMFHIFFNSDSFLGIFVRKQLGATFIWHGLSSLEFTFMIYTSYIINSRPILLMAMCTCLFSWKFNKWGRARASWSILVATYMSQCFHEILMFMGARFGGLVNQIACQCLIWWFLRICLLLRRGYPILIGLVDLRSTGHQQIDVEREAELEA